VIGSTTVPLDALEADVRARETNLGDFITDVMRADVQADVAILNGGGIRSNRTYPAGNITRRSIVSIFPFGDINCKVEITGATLLSALEHGVADLGADDGRFPQVSGISFALDGSKSAGHRVSEVRVNGQPLDAGRRYTLATNDYMLEGGDGYSMLASGQVLVTPEAGSLLSSVIESYVRRNSPIAPAIAGRIRIVPAQRVMLAPRPRPDRQCQSFIPAHARRPKSSGTVTLRTAGSEKRKMARSITKWT